MKKIALILGASEGLGFACAKALLEDGVQVCIVSRTEAKLARAVEELSKINSQNIISYAGDIAQEATLLNAKKLVESKWGKINILINSNGGPKAGKVTNLSDNDWKESFEKYALPVFRSIRSLVPDMIENNWGRIITIGSIAAKEPIENLDISNFIRSGFLGMHKTLSREVAKNNINVHNILPGSILTSRTEERILQRSKDLSISLEKSQEMSVAKIPKGKLGDPSDVGNLVAFLCSDKSGYLTGNSFLVDGGSSFSI